MNTALPTLLSGNGRWIPVTIPDEDRDLLLSDRLLEERHGILAWAIEGCAEWQRHGLAPPPAITGASAGYIDDEDTVGEWIEECCVTGPGCKAAARTLYANWAAWAEAAGATKGSQKSLGEALRERGFQPAKVGGARGWLGITPRPLEAILPSYMWRFSPNGQFDRQTA